MLCQISAIKTTPSLYLYPNLVQQRHFPSQHIKRFCCKSLQQNSDLFQMCATDFSSLIMPLLRFLHQALTVPLHSCISPCSKFILPHQRHPHSIPPANFQCSEQHNYQLLKARVLFFKIHSPSAAGRFEPWTQINIMVKEYTELEIKQITNNYSDQLGGGSFGKVYRGILTDGRDVAVKRIIFKQNENDKEWKHEKQMLEIFSAHDKFVEYVGYGVQKVGREGYLIMEWLPMSLREIVNCNGNVKDEVTEWRHLTDVLVQLANAMDHIHQAKFGMDRSTYVYGDMKPDNVMLQKTNEGYLVKLIDLGSISKVGSQNFTYTHGYAAPEIFNGSGLTVKTDVFCLGMIMIDLLTRESTTNKERAAEENRAKKDKNKNKDASKEKIEKAQYMLHQQGHIFSKWLRVRSLASPESMNRISLIALDCTKRVPEQRPDMKQAERRLRELRQ